MVESINEYLLKFISQDDDRTTVTNLFDAMKNILIEPETFFSAQDLIDTSSSYSSNILEFKFTDVIKHKFTTEYNHWSILVDPDENIISVYKNDVILIKKYYRDIDEENNGIDKEIMYIIINKYM